MEVELSAKAARQWKRLLRNPALLERLDSALDRMASDPYLGKLLGGEFPEVRSMRVGDWRILYKVFPKRRLVVVLSIADRKEVYR